MICPECHLTISFPTKNQKYHGKCGEKARGRIYRDRRRGKKVVHLQVTNRPVMTDEEWYKSADYQRLLSFGKRRLP